MQSLDDLEAEMKRILAPPDEPWRWARSPHLPDLKEWREYRRAWRGLNMFYLISFAILAGAVWATS